MCSAIGLAPRPPLGHVEESYIHTISHTIYDAFVVWHVLLHASYDKACLVYVNAMWNSLNSFYTYITIQTCMLANIFCVDSYFINIAGWWDWYAKET